MDHLRRTAGKAPHQAESGPRMKKLEDWMKAQIDKHRVEPNSGLGEAIQYMRKHCAELIEAYEEELGTIVHRRRHSPLPIVESKWKLLDAINQDLERIGLDVEPKERERLNGYLAERYGERT